jgi:hypothetical protein
LLNAQVRGIDVQVAGRLAEVHEYGGTQNRSDAARISKPQRINDISLKQRPLADISSEHLQALVAGLLHDVTFMLAALGSRGSKTRAQGVSAEIFGQETGMSHGSLDDQGYGSISEALGTNFPTQN